MIGSVWVDIERIKRVQVRRVVCGRPTQVAVETADHRKRPTDPKIAVKIDYARYRHVSFVVARGPREVRISQEDRLAGLRPARRKCPRIGTVVAAGLAALSI